MLYSIKTYGKDFLLDFYTKEKLLVPESFVEHWLPQLRDVEFVPEPLLTKAALDAATSAEWKETPSPRQEGGLLDAYYRKVN